MKITHIYIDKIIYEHPECNTMKELVEAAISNGIRLDGANLRGANLRDADLSRADLGGADLRDADLRSANLSDADLRHANLRRADLRDAGLSGAYLDYADLRYANLRRADLSRADLGGANLRDADLRSANLRGAYLSGADLRDADLRDTNLEDCTGNMREIKSLRLDHWVIVYTNTDLQIGCEKHPINHWFGFFDCTIDEMGRDSLDWWSRNKDYIRTTIERFPAVPHGGDKTRN